MSIPFRYSLKNFKSRKTTNIITVLGISLVVFVFTAVLMMAYGIQKTLIATGNEDNVIILRKSANAEISSIIDGETQNIIRALPYIKATNEGKQIISYEPVVIINLDKKSGGISNVTVRGVSPEINYLRPQVKLTEGKMFNWGSRELVVGTSIEKNFINAGIGGKVNFAGDEWTIVGKFVSDGSGFDSEFWGDSKQLLNAFNRGNTVSTVTLRLDDKNNFEKFKTAFDSDKRLKQFEPKIEKIFFEEQSELMANFIKILGIFITIIFSLGATIGAMITMYAAVANRTREIGTLRSLGFKRRSILVVFLFESVLISLVGGIIGIFFASGLQLFTISTLNFASFSEISFYFAITPDIIIGSLIFSCIMGIFGGFFPSIRAARMNIINALRAG
ncbi:MAG: multidrug ABC transporter permease [Ignavibacteriales bacterium CG_4_9_14_3_um_filter_30_11]|nr:MAG: multidrug ABC transporter permease [Ignavibacteriales bacterium CG_4_9_14_3_um_filter_30_11]